MSEPLTVSQVNGIIKQNLETDPVLQDVWVEGELADLRFYAQGQQYFFKLIDAQSQLSGVLYQTFFKNLKTTFQDGDRVFARGKIKSFNRKGTYTLQVSYMSKSGLGEAQQTLEALKKRLLEEGLFDPTTKKPLPPYCHSVALVTALDSAAMWDFMTIAKSFSPCMNITVVPAVMQGVHCPPSVIEALDHAERLSHVDAIVILRGGGSSDDLAGFNDEFLIRRIFACQKPVVAALGHEVDITLTDFVSDLRMPTPSAAAHHLAHPFTELAQTIKRLIMSATSAIQNRSLTLSDSLSDSLAIGQQQLSTLFLAQQTHLNQLLYRLGLADPLHKLRQGFSMTRLLSSGKVIRSNTELTVGDVVVTHLHEGQFYAKVTQIS